MRGEMIITEEILRAKFAGERDLITYAPYRCGDRIVRCAACRAIIKTEFVSDRCPLCGSTPFRTAPVDYDARRTPASASRTALANPSGQRTARRIDTSAQRRNAERRGLTLFFWLLLFSAFAAYIPFLFPDSVVFLREVAEVAFGIKVDILLIALGVISGLAATVLFFNRKTRKLWQRSKWGFLLVLVPMCAPYAVLAAILCVAALLALGSVLAVIAFVSFFLSDE